MAAPTREGIAGLAAPVVERAGLDLEEVVVTPAGKRRAVRIVVDGDDGVDLDLVASISHEVADLLDESDLMGQLAYTLEVTSPGVDRPLTLPRHWRRAIGRLVQVTPRQAAEFTGRVTAAQDDESGSVTLDVKGRERTIAYADVARAKVEVEFKRKGAVEDDTADDADTTTTDSSLSIDEE
jgi:ribosome maturation factor RimP